MVKNEFAVMAGDVVTVFKGCAARRVTKGTTLRVVSVESLGAEFGHSVRVVVENRALRTHQAWFARHINRLSDAVINLNDGNPFHTLKISALDKSTGNW
jgi:hypothetical protein